MKKWVIYLDAYSGRLYVPTHLACPATADLASAAQFRTRKDAERLLSLLNDTWRLGAKLKRIEIKRAGAAT